MHRALAVLEILDLIIDFIVEDEVKAPQIAYPLLLVDRSFYLTALPHVWKRLRSFLYLFKCYPPDLGPPVNSEPMTQTTEDVPS